MDRARFDAIRLARCPHVGPITYRQLVARFGSASEALSALPDLTRRGGGRGLALAEEGAVAAEIDRVSALGAFWLVYGDPDYPPLLAEIDDAPPVLICKGDPAWGRRDCVSMVGARNASAAACRFARGLARDLASRGLVVVSGLARGIDTAAHWGALGDGEGEGATIGVIASGIDIAYPPENAALQERVAREGLLIAEQSPGAEPKARNFPHRNRIIAGLCRATVVVEAAPKSGSLITARLANEYGREVLAVPGSPLDPRAQGCNQLIREGATLVQNADEVIEAISHIDPRAVIAMPGRGPTSAPAPEISTEERERVDLIDLLGPVPVPVDELIRQSGTPPAGVHMALLELELAGRLVRHAGGRVSLI